MAARGSSGWRGQHWPSCGDADLVTEQFSVGVKLAVARPAREAFHALFDTMAAYGYPVRSHVTGCYNCRVITGGSTLSSHAYAIAADVNWDTNPYLRGKLVTDMPKIMRDRILTIKTVDGLRVWRWGGDWDNRPDTPHSVYDPMHWEIIVTPAELEAGIERKRITTRVTGNPTLHMGSRGPSVEDLQRFLGITVDGRFGSQTDAAVKEYQESRGLTVDGWVGPATWTALTNDLPPVDEFRPGKDWS